MMDGQNQHNLLANVGNAPVEKLLAIGGALVDAQHVHEDARHGCLPRRSGNRAARDAYLLDAVCNTLAIELGEEQPHAWKERLLRLCSPRQTCL
jgi:hypothetical protein